MILPASLAVASLILLLIFARSTRAGFSGPIGTFMGIAQIPVVIAAIWLLAVTIGWWTIVAFIVCSILVGVLVRRETLGWWVGAQPLTGVGSAALIVGGWATRLM
jgi:hypothetical protein